MCGIAGAFGRPLIGPGGVPADMRSVLAHRGPDAFGWWQEDVTSLLHWRLSVIDVSDAGAQPMASRDGRFVVAYNGEAYNFEALRREIDARRAASAPSGEGIPLDPWPWRGHSDTEVVVEALALWGPEVLSRLNGMFAIAVYDRAARRLYLARDRAGIKPLYVWERDGLLLFASEAKFFFTVPGFSPAVDAKGLTAFFTYGQCHGDRHVLAGVRKVEPGEVIAVERGEGPGAFSVSRRRLADRPRWRPVARSDGDAAARLGAILSDAVARQLVADVPVGVLLSGGVDSSILTALCARHLGAPSTHAFTLGYPGSGADYDEIEFARRVARHLGVRHHVYEASHDDVVAEIERLVWHYDEPFADAAALNVLVLSRMIRSRVTVALAGEGSDELFGGYRRYQLERTLRSLGPIVPALGGVVRAAGLDGIPHLPRRLRVALRALSRTSAADRYSSYLESGVPADAVLEPRWQSPVAVHPAIADEYPDRLDGGPVSRLCIADQRFWLPGTYLEKSDKGSMAHGLELRVPFLDNEVVEFANSLPDDQRIRGAARKWLLREAFGHLLPAEVFLRFKRGFGVPVSRWLRRELREYYVDQVLSPTSRVQRYLRMREVERRFREHVRGTRDHGGLLWKCLILETWLRYYERGFRPAGSGAPSSDERRSREAAPSAAQTRTTNQVVLL